MCFFDGPADLCRFCPPVTDTPLNRDIKSSQERVDSGRVTEDKFIND